MKPKNQTAVLGFAAGIAFYSIPFLARALSNFVVIPIYTRYLTPADYGVLELLDLTSFLVATLIGTNFGQSLFYYYAAAQNPQERGEAVSTTFYGSLILAGFSIVFGVGMASPLGRLIFGNSQYTSFLRLVFGTLAFAFPAEVGLSCLRALEMAKTYSVISVSRLILGAVVNVILLVKFHLGFAALLWGSFWVTAATAVYLAWFNRHWLRFPFHWGLFVKLMKYSWPLNISGLATLALDLGDRYVLKRWVSLSDLGIYGLAYKFGMIVSMASLIFNQFWKPRMFTLVKAEGGGRNYVRICTYYAMALMFMAICLSVPLRPLLRLGVGPAFLPAVKYIPWIASIYVVRLLADFSRNAFFLNKRTGKEAQITWLAAGICIAGYLGFIPIFKLWGAILATGISFVAMFVVSFWQAQKVQHFDFEYGRLLAVGGCGAGIIAGYSMLEPRSVILQLVLAVLSTLLFPAALFLGGFFREDERAAIAGLLRTARAKVRSAVTVEG
jgi:O-antigen/teichoic acid export membrane protein